MSINPFAFPQSVQTPLLLCVFLSLLVGCEQEPPVEPASTEQTVLTVETVTLEAKPFVYPVSSFGRLVSAEKVNVGVEVAGTVASVFFSEGQRVQAGDKLLALDSTKQQLRLSRAEANLDGAQAELKQAQQSFERFSSLGDKGAVSKDELNRIESTYENAKARLAQFHAERTLAAQELSDLLVLSPVDGVIESERVEPGQKVMPGESLGVLQAGNSLQVVTFVNEAEVNELSVGDLASVAIARGHAEPLEARVESIALTANAQTGNFEVKLRLQNSDGRLREGMSARVSLMIGSGEPIIAVPRGAVVDRNRQRLVYVLDGGTAHAKAPRFGLSVGDGWSVLEGLNAGERVIVSPLAQVFDGLPVSAAEPTPTAAAE